MKRSVWITLLVIAVIGVYGIMAGSTEESSAGMPAESSAQAGKWTKKSDMPTARGGFATAVVDGAIYVIGGGMPPSTTPPSTGAVDTAVVEVYDPIKNTWSKKANMPTPRRNVSACVLNDKIYVIGGWSFEEINYDNGETFRRIGGVVRACEEYDPKTDKWTKKTDMPTARGGLATAVVDGKIYAIGGRRSHGKEVYLGTVEEYDPSTDKWISRANMPTPRSNISASVVNGKIYVFGGWREKQTKTKEGTIKIIGTVSTVEEYDPKTDKWNKKADMLTGGGGIATCVISNEIYAIGGTVTPEQPDRNVVEKYNPNTNKWIPVCRVPNPRYNIPASVVGEKIYLMGGWTLGGEKVVPDTEEFIPPVPSAP
jgi:N-acetylneuraminic acid mutarotase